MGGVLPSPGSRGGSVRGHGRPGGPERDWPYGRAGMDLCRRVGSFTLFEEVGDGGGWSVVGGIRAIRRHDGPRYRDGRVRACSLGTRRPSRGGTPLVAASPARYRSGGPRTEPDPTRRAFLPGRLGTRTPDLFLVSEVHYRFLESPDQANCDKSLVITGFPAFNAWHRCAALLAILWAECGPEHLPAPPSSALSSHARGRGKRQIRRRPPTPRPAAL